MSKKLDLVRLSLEQEASGLSITAFCRKRGINPQRMYTYRSERAKKERIPRAAAFVPAVLSSSEQMIEVKSGGFSIRIPTGLSTAELVQIFKALQEAV